MKALRPLIATLTLAILAGCAAPPATKLSTTVKTQVAVKAASVEIDDLASDRKVRNSEGVYFTGWLPVPDEVVSPPFHAAFAKKLEGSLRADGSSEQSLQISIIDAGFFMDSLASDSVVFVGIAAAFRERPYKCNAVVNIRIGSKRERREFESTLMANRAYGDLPDKDVFIGKCQDELVAKVAAFVVGF